jgi:trehalose 6-phosphate phosphatase
VTDEAFAPPRLDDGMALFIDFDGTLAAIAPRPDAVVVDDWVRPLLTLARQRLGGAVAVISGRPLAELDAFLAPLVLPAAGVHGVERRDAEGRVRVLAGAPPDDLAQAAEWLAARHDGLLVERKPSALALHYRARPELEELCAQTLLAAARPHQDAWTVLLGKCVVELKPQRASKGEAVRDFLALPPFAGRVPVFVGDDATDEEGFAAVQAAGGCGVKVGPGPSGARCRLDDPAAVRDWLRAALQPLGPDEVEAPVRALAAAALGGLA